MKTEIAINLFKLIIFIFLAQITACKYPERSHSEVEKNIAISIIEEKALNSILVCAHRCYHSEAPENSLEAIRKGINIGIDIQELDVRTTKDSVLVLMHDKTIDRTTDGKGKVADYTFLELQAFNLKMGESITKEKIPLLEDALDILKSSECIANLDLKAVSYKQLYDMLQEKGMQHSVISFIGKKKKVMKMLSIDSCYAILPLSRTIDDVEFYIENTKSILQHFTTESYTKELIELAQQNKQLIFVNTLWDEDDSFTIGNTSPMDSVIALRPAIIQTDYPKDLMNYLRKKGLHD